MNKSLARDPAGTAAVHAAKAELDGAELDVVRAQRALARLREARGEQSARPLSSTARQRQQRSPAPPTSSPSRQQQQRPSTSICLMSSPIRRRSSALSPRRSGRRRGNATGPIGNSPRLPLLWRHAQPCRSRPRRRSGPENWATSPARISTMG